LYQENYNNARLLLSIYEIFKKIDTNPTKKTRYSYHKVRRGKNELL